MPLITPQFSLTQDEKYVIIKLRLPYVKPTKSEFSVIGNQFSFYLKPYLLKLQFNEILKETETPAKVVYNPNEFELTVYLEKLTLGEDFTQLDMLGLLMNKKSKKNKKPPKGQLVQVIDSEEQVEDKQFQQSNENTQIYANPYLYGFNNQYKDVFNDLEEELLELAILDPKEIPQQNRQQLAFSHIEQEFDKEVYIFDLFENEFVDQILEWDPQWTQQFSINEINKLSSFGKREYLIDSFRNCLLGVVDILFAYLYEYTIFQGELTSESAATINQLSSQFSAFYLDNNLEKLLISNYQRAVTFPMIRSFEICEKIKIILTETLKSKVLVVKILLDVFELFSKSKPRQYLNIIYLEDYIVWVQSIKEQEFQDLSKEIQNIQIKKEYIKLNLEEIEKQAALVAII